MTQKSQAPEKHQTGSGPGWLRRRLRATHLWIMLRETSAVQSVRWFAKEVQNAFGESRVNNIETVDREFQERLDPWNYEVDSQEQMRFRQQAELLDAARKERLFASGLEIGCAEGLFTEFISDRCESLLVLDISPTALERAQSRRRWSESVRFGRFDLLRDTIPGTFSLIVLAGVLEYFYRPATFSMVREKLISALKPGGYPSIENTRANLIVEDSWWGKYLIRGRWINDFFSRHPSLSNVSTVTSDSFAITMFQKVESDQWQSRSL